MNFKGPIREKRTGCTPCIKHFKILNPKNKLINGKNVTALAYKNVMVPHTSRDAFRLKTVRELKCILEDQNKKASHLPPSSAQDADLKKQAQKASAFTHDALREGRWLSGVSGCVFPGSMQARPLSDGCAGALKQAAGAVSFPPRPASQIAIFTGCAPSP